MSSPGQHIEFEFKFPSLTYLRFNRMRLLLADCPIDDGKTWRHACYYQDVLKVPLLGKAFAWLLVLQDWHLLQKRQDLPVAVTQEPRVPVPGCDRLVRADA